MMRAYHFQHFVAGRGIRRSYLDGACEIPKDVKSKAEWGWVNSKANTWLIGC